MAKTARERLEAAEPAGSVDEYREVCRLRCEAFAEHLAAMESPPDELRRWAAFMFAYHGPRVRVHRIVYDNWLVALLVVRYGEALYHWPQAFSEGDLARAKRWQEGQTPKPVQYVSAETATGFVEKSL